MTNRYKILKCSIAIFLMAVLLVQMPISAMGDAPKKQ